MYKLLVSLNVHRSAAFKIIFVFESVENQSDTNIDKKLRLIISRTRNRTHLEAAYEV